MSEDLIIEKCSPTMAGIKTGSLFSCEETDIGSLYKTIKRINSSLVPKGVRMIPMKYENNRALVYMYRPKKLSADLTDPTAKSILSTRNYSGGGADYLVAQLRKRLNESDSFPHEIGLFLGYPPEDVNGFINDGPRNAKLTGAWKVFSDEESAKRKFELYKKCRRVYKNAYKKHNSFDKLVVTHN